MQWSKTENQSTTLISPSVRNTNRKIKSNGLTTFTNTTWASSITITISISLTNSVLSKARPRLKKCSGTPHTLLLMPMLLLTEKVTHTTETSNLRPWCLLISHWLRMSRPSTLRSFTSIRALMTVCCLTVMWKLLSHLRFARSLNKRKSSLSSILVSRSPGLLVWLYCASRTTPRLMTIMIGKFRE